jgi:hypothetical protein
MGPGGGAGGRGGRGGGGGLGLGLGGSTALAANWCMATSRVDGTGVQKSHAISQEPSQPVVRAIAHGLCLIEARDSRSIRRNPV